MATKALSFLAVLAVLACLGSSQDHLPFLSPPTAGLSQLPAVDDGASGPLSIPINFLFDGVTQDTVYVNTNGVFSFGSRLTSPPSFSAFTSSGQSYLVAPYWTDIYLNRGGGAEYGTLFANDSDSGILVDEVSSFITEQTGEEFTGVWMLAATWVQVRQSSGTETNTFQGILTTDGTDAYAVFIYKCGELEWARSSTVIGIKATSYYRNYPSTGNEATTVACIDNSPNTEFRNLVYKLSTGETCSLISGYGCNNGNCADASGRCDGIEDCGDGSDEIACTCPDNKFRCNDGQCIPSDDRCDVITQCTDDSDEEDCPCESYEFECDNNKCVSEASRCDDSDDCGDNSDEDGCVNLGLAIGLSVGGFTLLLLIGIPLCIFCCGARGKYYRLSFASRLRRSTPVTTVTTAVYTTTHEEQDFEFDKPDPAFGSPAEAPPPDSPDAYPASGYEAPPPYATAPSDGSYVPQNPAYPAYPPQAGYPEAGVYPPPSGVYPPSSGAYPPPSDVYPPYPYPAYQGGGGGGQVSFPTEPK